KDFDGLITGSVDSVIRGKLFDPQAKVEVGEKIMTSGVGLYPKGILIGEIKEVIVDQNDLLTEVIVEPSVNFKRLNKVLVVPAAQTAEESILE
ncbi:Rod shape-determining protein MreC like protein, partial [Aduncisulcus paluster]